MASTSSSSWERLGALWESCFWYLQWLENYVTHESDGRVGEHRAGPPPHSMDCELPHEQTVDSIRRHRTNGATVSQEVERSSFTRWPYSEHSWLDAVMGLWRYLPWHYMAIYYTGCNHNSQEDRRCKPSTAKNKPNKKTDECANNKNEIEDAPLALELMCRSILVLLFEELAMEYGTNNKCKTIWKYWQTMI